MGKSAGNPTTTTTRTRNAKITWRLSLMVVGMFGFGFALVPLYDLLCEVTGLGGKTGGAYAYEPANTRPDTTRLISVNFTTNTNAGMPWEFWAEKGGMRVHPGELRQMNFFMRNTTRRRMIAQAVPSVVPARAAEYFHKTECFCFEQQVLEPGELLEMPMRFIIDRRLPKNVQSVSLSYELFDVTYLEADDLVAGHEGHQE